MVQYLTEQEKRFLRVGDVISYHSGGMLKQHRIVEADSGYYYVHGDNNHSTERVNLDQIDGKVVGASPWMGKSVVFVKDHFLLILAAMSLLCFAFIILAMSGRDPEKEAAR